MNETYDYVEISYKSLSKEALDGVIEEYITREGTDYGEYEYSFIEKKEKIYTLLKDDKIKIYFDNKTSTCQLVNK